MKHDETCIFKFKLSSDLENPDARGSKLQSDRKLRRNRLRHREIAAKVGVKNWSPPAVCFKEILDDMEVEILQVSLERPQIFYNCFRNSTE